MGVKNQNERDGVPQLSTLFTDKFVEKKAEINAICLQSSQKLQK